MHVCFTCFKLRIIFSYAERHNTTQQPNPSCIRSLTLLTTLAKGPLRQENCSKNESCSISLHTTTNRANKPGHVTSRYLNSMNAPHSPKKVKMHNEHSAEICNAQTKTHHQETICLANDISQQYPPSI